MAKKQVSIDWVTELEANGYSYDQTNEARGTCRIVCPHPEHLDENPSAVLNTRDEAPFQSGDWHCYACHKSGGADTALAAIRGIPLTAAAEMLTVSGKTVKAQLVDKYHKGIYSDAAQSYVAALKHRGISDESIRRYSIGFRPNEGDGKPEAITIPIISGTDFANIRYYRPGDKLKKFANHGKGYQSETHLYPWNQLGFERIIVCGGELKALVAAQHLNEHDIGAVSHTGGEGNWSKKLNALFTGKIVYVCYDIDAAGQTGAKRVCNSLLRSAKEVYNIVLPLHEAIYPGGDLNDLFGPEERTAEFFMVLMDRAELWQGEKLVESYASDPVKDTRVIDLRLPTEPFNFRTRGYVSGASDDPLFVAKSLHLRCGEDSMCASCDLGNNSEYQPEGWTYQVDPKSNYAANILTGEMDALKKSLGVPLVCKTLSCEPSDETHTFIPATLTAAIGKDGDHTTRNIAVFLRGDAKGKTHDGHECEVVGRVVRTESALVPIVSEHTKASELFDFADVPTDGLEVFKPVGDSYEALEAKVKDITEDNEKHVTHIFGRPDMHLAYDLAYFSPLEMEVNGRLRNAWVSILVVGATAEGKSTVLNSYIEHYQNGTYVQGTDCSVAGLIGGVATVGIGRGHQVVRWGKLPQNDGRLVGIEEFAAAKTDLVVAMRAVRSEGVVKVDKIASAEIQARVRTIVLSNPRIAGDAEPTGMTAIRSIVSKREDQRRFDLTLWLGQNNREEESTSYTVIGEQPKYSSDISAKLLRWAWSIPADRIIIGNGAIRRAFYSDVRERYSDFWPVGTMDFPYKLLRLAAALALRTYSVDDKGNCLVQERHVQYIENMMHRIYGHPAFGYKAFMNFQEVRASACTPNNVCTVLRKATGAIPLLSVLGKGSEVTRQMMLEALGTDTITEGEAIINSLLGRGALQVLNNTDDFTRRDTLHKASPELLKIMDDVIKLLEEFPDMSQEDEF